MKRRLSSLLERLETVEAQLDLAHHDIDKLHAEREAELSWLGFLLAAGLVRAAREAIWEWLQ
ncbi:hypothetical protein [Mesorhizobium captivum]|uniref:hypothetical protein n=1 Tax=Mesorhizobium captivum TaxID=3072319 RepID=UPI002A23F025|nr:hypothetical protein [Mesorhizobium sp. VK3C]MDX8445333.1 hypothetical protein [Mesorhizobium sp. VK3C]